MKSSESDCITPGGKSVDDPVSSSLTPRLLHDPPESEPSQSGALPHTDCLCPCHRDDLLLGDGDLDVLEDFFRDDLREALYCSTAAALSFSIRASLRLAVFDFSVGAAGGCPRGERRSLEPLEPLEPFDPREPDRAGDFERARPAAAGADGFLEPPGWSCP